MLNKFTIYGERCSGTCYLQNLITQNFDAQITWKFGWKHFFGFQDKKLKNSDDVLFICIVRNIVDWINSFYIKKHHLPLKYKKNLNEHEKINEFLNKEFWSFNDMNKNLDLKNEIMEDRNIYTGKRYKNIFELRHTKLQWMLNDLPKKVKHCIIIKYEDLLNDFDNTLFKIKNKGLAIKKNINFPVNNDNYKHEKKKYVKKNIKEISSIEILYNPNIIPKYEIKLYNIT